MKVKKMHRRNRKKGMTLVELIISTAAGVVVIAAACSVLYFGYSNYASGTTDLTNHQNASLLESYFQHDLAVATTVTVTAGAEQTAANTSVSGVQSAGDKIISMHFNSDNVLVITENGGTPVKITGIQTITLKTDTIGNVNRLNYEITASENKRSFVLTGGVVLNNCTECKMDKTTTIPQKDKTLYFNIQMPKVTMQSST